MIFSDIFSDSVTSQAPDNLEARLELGNWEENQPDGEEAGIAVGGAGVYLGFIPMQTPKVGKPQNTLNLGSCLPTPSANKQQTLRPEGNCELCFPFLASLFPLPHSVSSPLGLEDKGQKRLELLPHFWPQLLRK